MNHPQAQSYGPTPEREAEPSGDEAVYPLIAAIASARAQGASHDQILTMLVETGVEREAANQLASRVIGDVDFAASSEEIPRWVWYAGGLVLVNLCSAIFDWPFWIY
jgi:hypothetical protein